MSKRRRAFVGMRFTAACGTGLVGAALIAGGAPSTAGTLPADAPGELPPAAQVLRPAESAPHPTVLPATADATDNFQTADRCIACHKGVAAEDGTDVSIGFDWRASMMANAARDPYFHAAVRREIMDYPEAAAAIEGECARCHMPMATVAAIQDGGSGAVFANLPIGDADGPYADLAADGVSCALCHQIQPDGLGTEATFTARFEIAAETPAEGRPVFGPFEPDEGGVGIMHSATGFRPTLGEHVTSSGLCASCHTVITHAVQDGGSSGPPFPEQSPYLEWQASIYADGAEREHSCQDCHMPEVGEDVPVTRVLGRARPEVSRHVFRGGNFFMLRMLNRYRAELGVTALPQELELAAERTADHLRTATATVEIGDPVVNGNRLETTVTVRNQAGHKFPTAYPSRRAWLRVAVTDAAGRLVFESGALNPDGSVTGDDHDENGAGYEPHYTTIESPDQVQVYQGVMVDAAGAVTTGLMSAARWVKDNRILPDGFDAARADARVRPIGAATSDPDFAAGSDAVRYSVAVDPSAGPFTIVAELWFQPIGYRWAENLAPYDAPETQRFVAYYRDMSESSALLLASVEAVGGSE
ncbi:MAG: hypothetical protein OXF01_01335 [Gemmatimonadetes bacterium]|nr:hypothetical protein [Gemmatimonadota bacterium]